MSSVLTVPITTENQRCANRVECRPQVMPTILKGVIYSTQTCISLYQIVPFNKGTKTIRRESTGNRLRWSEDRDRKNPGARAAWVTNQV